MKNLIMSIIMVLMVSTVSFANTDSQPYTALVPSMGITAEWVAEFANIYNDEGVYQAVADIMGDGITPLSILTNGLDIEGINPQNLIAALYCAGAKTEDIRSASESNGISGLILVAGYETAKTVCGDEITDTQAYTEIYGGFNGVPSGSVSGASYGIQNGSPNTFTN